jgi:nicotinamide-nucleotide amidase
MNETREESRRPIRRAVVLAVGSELTTGETRDTNSGDLAAALSRAGVAVEWISALPDTLDTVVAAVARALEVADLVVTTGGLGPTPDDLTREAIAAVCGEEPAVDPKLAAWLRHLFERRGLPFHDTNIKQAWLIPSSRAMPNERGTAPGWWVDRPDGRIVVALPGPPREMSAMWETEVLPRLQERGLGRERVTRTYRLTGIGESAVATALGETLLRGINPIVATYARADAVDVRITAVAADGRSPTELFATAEEQVLAAVGDYVWGHDDDTWPVAIGREIARLGWRVALLEIGTGGTAARLLGEAIWLKSARLASPEGSGALRDLAVSGRAAARVGVGGAVRARSPSWAAWMAGVGPASRRPHSCSASLRPPPTGKTEQSFAAGRTMASYTGSVLRRNW